MGTITCRNPATGEILRELQTTEPAELAAVFDRARVAQLYWAEIPVAARAERLLKLRECLLNHLDEVASLISTENGKPRFEALANELLPSVELLTFFGKKSRHLLREQRVPLRLLKHRASHLQYWPLGITAIISPWNYPFLLPFGEIAMALVAGNAVVFKPSEATPLVGLKIQELCDEAGFPKDILQAVIGDGAVGAAVIQQKPNKIFFTGSVATGKKIMAASAEHLIPVCLELGGKDAMIVLGDANIDYASSAALWGAFSNSGQVCASVERILVHESVLVPFVSALRQKAESLRQGVPRGFETDLGAITYERQKAVYERHLAQARETGAVFVTGGEFSPDRRFLKPTIITGPNVESLDVFNEETFGPVVAVSTFRTVREAIEKTNRSPYGLLASIITGNLALAEEIAAKLHVGTVTINEVVYTAGLPETPWGGVKESGFGRKHAEMGLYEFVNVRHVHKPKTSLFVFKSPWWFPYTEFQYATFREFFELYRSRWTRKLRAIPHVLWNFVQFLKREKRL